MLGQVIDLSLMRLRVLESTVGLGEAVAEVAAGGVVVGALASMTRYDAFETLILSGLQMCEGT